MNEDSRQPEVQTSDCAIVAQNLTKRFQNFTAVDDISFSVRKGEFYGILGPNGAGKTTTIRMLTGVLSPDGGSVEIDGIKMSKNPLSAKQRMGVIPEIGTVYTDLSARDNLELFGMYYGLSKAVRKEKSEQMLKDLDLHQRADDLVKTFSKGMKQRISIGCAMIHEPSVLFLDEPTEGLDVQSRKLILDKVRVLNAKGCTVVLTTHNIEEASRLCHRVCIINKGHIVAVDSPENLKSAFDESRSVEVAFDRRVGCEQLSGSCVAKIEESGDKLRIFTSDLDETITSIMKLRDEQGLKIISLSTLGPSLEDAFLMLTAVKR